MKALPVALLLVSLCSARGALESSIQALAAVEREGRGNQAASAAWREVVAVGPEAIPQILAATGKGSPVADNWLRLAANTIVDRSIQTKQPLALEPIESFLKDLNHSAMGRRLAFDLLSQADSAKANEIEPSLINDPVQELRRGAVQRLMDSAGAGSPEQAKATYLKALEAVRDEDQTKSIAAELKKLGTDVDLPKHFGFLMNWQIIGPFENADRAGFDAVYPPEKELRFEGSYDGKGKPVQWQAFKSQDEYGKLDFNKPFGSLKESTAYAATIVESPEDREAELRLGCKNAWKVWLNGELLFSRDEYHRGQQMDQYKMRCRLKKGANAVLVKCCQNEQKEQWTVEWEFQLRLCDSTGTAILAAQ